MFGPNSPFATTEQISAEMNREAAQLVRQVAPVPLPGPRWLMSADTSNLPLGTKVYSLVATLSFSGVCTPSREIIAARRGQKPHVISRNSGSCTPSPGFSILDEKLFTAARAQRTQLYATKAEQARSAPARVQQVAWVPY